MTPRSGQLKKNNTVTYLQLTGPTSIGTSFCQSMGPWFEPEPGSHFFRSALTQAAEQYTKRPTGRFVVSGYQTTPLDR